MKIHIIQVYEVNDMNRTFQRVNLKGFSTLFYPNHETLSSIELHEIP